MSPLYRFGLCVSITTSYACFGCRSSSISSSHLPKSAHFSEIQSSDRQISPDIVEENFHAKPVAYNAEEDASVVKPAQLIEPMPTTDELDLDNLIATVHARHPSLQAALAAWQESQQRYPQEQSLQDPFFQSMIAPASLASHSPIQSSYYVGLTQAVPWRGKRELRGQKALWEAKAMSSEADDIRRELTSFTRLAFLNYYLVYRELELNVRNSELIQDFRSSAKSKYEAGQVSQQDISDADLALSKLQKQQIELDASKTIAIARINTLLHQEPDQALSPPPKRLRDSGELPDASVLRTIALERRPELAALSSRIQVERNTLALACKDYYPDFELMSRYDRFWTDHEQRPQLGLNMNIPVHNARRAAAVREAQYRICKLVSEFSRKQDEVREEVQIAHARVSEKQKTVKLFQDKILSTAESNLKSARATYVSGTIDFLRLLEAQRQFTEQQIEFERTLAEFQRSCSELELAVGGPIEQ